MMGRKSKLSESARLVRRAHRRARRRSRLVTLLRLSPWVLGSIAAAVGALQLFREFVPIDLLVPTNDMIGNALQTLGTVYAVLLAFVVFVVWGQFNDARAAVEREANSVGDLYRVLKGIPEPACSRVRQNLVEYIDQVLQVEWPAMACMDEHTTAGVTAELEFIWKELLDLRPADDRDQTILSEAMAHFNDVSDARSARLSAARVRMPFALRALLYLGAVTTVGMLFVQGVENFVIHAFAVGALAGAIAHVIYVIEDLDDAFSGNWQVPRDPFLRLRAHFDGA